MSSRAHTARRGRASEAVKRPCVFVGPSLSGHPSLRGLDTFPPAMRGALTAAVRAGYTRIGFIDGAIEAGTRLPLGELRQALTTPDVELIGGASMGAVRAAQLHSVGMRGVGRVFRLLRRGRLADSDEVHVLHAPAALRYRCLTLPLVNIRYTLRSMRQSGLLDAAEERAIVRYMREVPWFDRDTRSLSAAVFETCGRSRSGSLMQAFDCSYRDVKREDALIVLSALLRPVA